MYARTFKRSVVLTFVRSDGCIVYCIKRRKYERTSGRINWNLAGADLEVFTPGMLARGGGWVNVRWYTTISFFNDKSHHKGRTDERSEVEAFGRSDERNVQEIVGQ